MATKNQAKKVKAKVKAKKEEVTQELPKNPQEYSYRGDELIEIPASLFLLLYRANETALQKGVKRKYPTAFEWISVATQLPVQNPKEIDIKEGRVTQVMSIGNTFSQENMVESFDEWLFPNIIQAKEALISVHNKAVQDGIAVKISELQEEAQKKAAEQKAAAEAEGEK